MHESAASMLSAWANFYVMVGGAAAALTGLMFVVITLVSGVERTLPSHDGIGTFSTPTVLYFCSALVVSATFCAPWHELFVPGVLVGLTGLSGCAYVMRTMFRARRLESYKPDLEDWTWFWCLPFVAFATMLAAGITLPRSTGMTVHVALFAIGAAVVLLIFIGIRNSWDVVTYLAISSVENEDKTGSNDS
jgi:hypothetical protein